MLPVPKFFLVRLNIDNKKYSVFAFSLVLVLLSFYCKAQTSPLPTAKFTFDNKNDEDLISHKRINQHGYIFCEDRFGNSNHAVYLFGNEYSYLNLGNSPALKPKEGSISMWVMIQIGVYTGTGFEDNPILLTKNTDKDDFFESYGIYLDLNARQLIASCTRDSLEQVRIFSKNKINVSEWHHVVVVYNNSYMAFYVDGELQGKMDKTFQTEFLATDSVLVGVSANKKNNRFMEGAVDDIAFYNTALSPEQIGTLYNAPNPNRLSIYLKWTYRTILVLVLIILITWLATKRYKSALKKEHERDQLFARMNELETKAIRSQMNPHFMFNSLNTLQRFLLEKDFDNSHLFLTRFSRLLRKMLESSTSDLIALPEEISILDTYLQLENQRSDNSFKYTIINHVANANEVFIPVMLIQPFAENAVWHGLMTKKGERTIEITFKDLDAQRIQCIVDDNGVGRSDATRRKDPLKRKSLATEFVRQRLELIQKSSGVKCSFEFIDKKDEASNSLGTTVILTIPKSKQYDTRTDNR